MEWKCDKVSQIQENEANWDSVWTMAILSQYQYMAKASRCFIWDGTIFVTWPNVNDRSSTLQEKETDVSWWKCGKVYNCSTIDKAIQAIPPLAAALKYGCLCRGLRNDLKLTEEYIPKRGTICSCKRSAIWSPGHLVWTMSDGTWTTHLPVDGKVRQITLGMPTLCPIWKKPPFRVALENLKME